MSDNDITNEPMIEMATKEGAWDASVGRPSYEKDFSGTAQAAYRGAYDWVKHMQEETRHDVFQKFSEQMRRAIKLE